MLIRSTAAAAVMFFAVGQARAATVTYTLTDQTYDYHGDPQTIRQHPTMNLSIQLDSAAVARGSYNVHVQGSGSPGIFSITGDAADWVGFSAIGETVTPSSYVNLFIGMAFDAFGNVTSAAVDFGGYTEGGNFRGNANSFGGFFGGDENACASSYCSVNGRLVATTISNPIGVPEPASIAVLAIGIAGMVAARRRSRKTH